MRRLSVGLLLTGALATGCTTGPSVVRETSAPTGGVEPIDHLDDRGPVEHDDRPDADPDGRATALARDALREDLRRHNLRPVRETGSTDAYQQYIASFDGDGLTISGRLLVPRGNGPFPAVVLAHGYADPAVYDNTSQMSREHKLLARQGYVTLLVDYRNHALSSKDPNTDATLRLGYAVDVINAAKALQQDPRVRPDRIALMGRSMGGGVTYTALVAAPGLFKAGIAYAPVSSNSINNFEKWTRPDRATTQRVVATLGEPAANPDAWAKASPRTYFDRITEPVMIHQGTADLSCPMAAAQASVEALKAAGKSGRVRHLPRAAARLHDGPLDHLDPARRIAFLKQHLA